jgi:MoxR-like ATPase
MGASPRGSLALLLTSRAYAVLRGRDYVTPEDVKAVAHACLDHRVTVRPELWMNDVSAASVVDSVLSSVPTPAATGSSARTGYERP